MHACVYVCTWNPLSARGTAHTWKITISQHIWDKNVLQSQAGVLKLTGLSTLQASISLWDCPFMVRGVGGEGGVGRGRGVGPVPSALHPPGNCPLHVSNLPIKCASCPCTLTQFTRPGVETRGSGNGNWDKDCSFGPTAPCTRSLVGAVGGYFPHLVGWKAGKVAARE